MPIESPGFVKKKWRVYCWFPLPARLGGVLLNMRIMDGMDVTAKTAMHSVSIIQKQLCFFNLPVKRSCGVKRKRKMKLEYIPFAGDRNIAAINAVPQVK